MTDEREIDLLELIAEVLKHWKGMILFMLIGAIAVGVFDYAKANYYSEKKRTEEAVEMTYAEKKAVDIALEYEKLYVEAKDNGDAENLVLLNKTVIDLVNSFNDKQLEYFNNNSISELWKGSEQDIIKKEEVVLEDNTTIGISPKMVVIGAVAFAFIYCMIWALKYIFDGNIKISDDLHRLINADLIGSIITVKEPSFVLDKLIYRLKHHGVKVLPVEDSLELIASVISVNAKNGEINEVAFAGCELKKKAYEYCEKLAAILKDSHGLDSKILGDIVYNKDDVETLADEKGIVLIETAGASAYSDIQREMQLINQLSINVIGGVIIE